MAGASKPVPVVGLYYPWIHFRDDDWVKVAMLYWLRLQRIVPSDYKTHDSETVRAFVDRELIGDHDAGPSRERVASVFEQRQDELRAQFGIAAADLWTQSAPVRHFEIPGVDESVKDRLAYIHVDKIAYSLRRALVDTGLGLLFCRRILFIGCVRPMTSRR